MRPQACRMHMKRLPADATKHVAVDAASLSVTVTNARLPLAPERYKIQFTASREMHERLRREAAVRTGLAPPRCPGRRYRDALRSSAVGSHRGAGEAEVRRYVEPPETARECVEIPPCSGRGQARGLAA